MVGNSEQPKTGRPSEFTQDIADTICSELAIGKSLRTVCEPDDMPSVKTIFNWFRAYPDFLQQYTRAKQEAADSMVDEMQYLADNVERDKDAIAKARLQVDTRKWIASKLKPKAYGDKLDVESGGKPITFIVNRGGDEQTDDND